MEFFKQYLKIINYAMIGLVFSFACFYLFSNIYHYFEIRKDFVTNFSTQSLVLDFQKKMSNVSQNISNFNANTYHGNLSANQMQSIYHNLESCTKSFQNTTIKSMMEKDRITIIDVYQLRESYENDILSSCIVNNLYWTTLVTPETYNSAYLLNNKNMMQLYFNALLDETSYLKKDLLNNSSYFYNTSIASSSIKDTTKDGFYEVMGAYGKAASFVEFVSEWFRNEVEGTL